MDIGKEIDASSQPNRVRRQVSSSGRIVVAMVVIMQTSLIIVVLARKPLIDFASCAMEPDPTGGALQ